MATAFVLLLLLAADTWWRGLDHEATGLLAVACLVGLVLT